LAPPLARIPQIDWLPADLGAPVVKGIQRLAWKEAARSDFTRCTHRGWALSAGHKPLLQLLNSERRAGSTPIDLGNPGLTGLMHEAADEGWRV
jgi:hypothetical protein